MAVFLNSWWEYGMTHSESLRSVIYVSIVCCTCAAFFFFRRNVAWQFRHESVAILVVILIIRNIQTYSELSLSMSMQCCCLIHNNTLAPGRGLPSINEINKKLKLQMTHGQPLHLWCFFTTLFTPACSNGSLKNSQMS
jgi:hypothetical protein